MKFTDREIAILQVLLEEEQGNYHQILDLAHRLNVSTRTIKRDVKNMEENGILLEKITGKGICLGETVEGRKQLEERMKQKDSYNFSEEEKCDLFLLELLSIPFPTKRISIAIDMKLSMFSTNKILQQLEEKLNTYTLALEKKRGYGVEITGSEWNKRRALNDIFFRWVSAIEFFYFIHEEMEHLGPMAVKVLDPLKEHGLHQMIGVAEDISRKFSQHISDEGQIQILFNLMLSSYRFQQGFLLEPVESSPLGMLGYAKHLMDYLGFGENQEEVVYLCEFLEDIRLKELPLGYMVDDMYLFSRVQLFLERLSQDLEIDLTQSKRVIHELTVHIQASIRQLLDKMTIRNPLLMKIKGEYGNLFLLVEKYINEIFPEISIPEDEIAYIVMHIGAYLSHIKSQEKIKALIICTNGIASSKMLSAKLLSTFHGISEIKVESLFGYKNQDLSQYDLILTTVPIFEKNHSFLHVTPMLTQQDIGKIEEYLLMKPKVFKKGLQSSEKIGFAEKLNDLEEKLQFFKTMIYAFKLIFIQQETVIEAIHQICENLFQENIISEVKPLEDIFQHPRTNERMMIEGSNILFLHTKHKSVTQGIIRIYRNKTPLIFYGQRQVKNIFLMVCPENASVVQTQCLSCVSGLIVENETNLQLFSGKDIEEMKNLLVTGLQQF